MDSQNLHRRHLTLETQKRLRAERVERVMHKRTVEGKSIRQIAEEEGVSARTIQFDLKAGVDPSTPAPPPKESTNEASEAKPESSRENGEASSPAPRTAARPSPANGAAQSPPAPAKVTGRDGKQYAATRPQTTQKRPSPPKADAEPSREAKSYGVKGIGVFKANEAIDCLSRIPKNDPFRKRAKEIVLDWIKYNLSDGHAASEPHRVDDHLLSEARKLLAKLKSRQPRTRLRKKVIFVEHEEIIPILGRLIESLRVK